MRQKTRGRTAREITDLRSAGKKTPTLRVLVVVRDDATRTKVLDALRRSEDIAVCGEEPTAVAAVARAVQETPDVCLIDKDVAGGAIPAAWEISARLPRTKVVLITGSERDSSLVLALTAGISGVVERDADMERLPAILSDVMNGKIALPRDAVSVVVAELCDRRARRRSVSLGSRAKRLTSREWEVLDLLCAGHGTVGIARRLGVSPATVRSHTAHALRKLGLPNREAAVRKLGRR